MSEHTPFTPDEEHLLRLLLKLPTTFGGDNVSKGQARVFWKAMTESLPRSMTNAPASRADQIIEAHIARVTRARRDPPASGDPAVELRIAMSGLATQVFAIFGDLTERQKAALPDGLGSGISTGEAFAWLRELHRTALKVKLDRPLFEGQDVLEELSLKWGAPRQEDARVVRTLPEPDPLAPSQS